MGYFIAAMIGGTIGFLCGALLASSKKADEAAVRCLKSLPQSEILTAPAGRYDFHTVEGFEELFAAVSTVNECGYEIVAAAPLREPFALVFRRPA